VLRSLRAGTAAALLAVTVSFGVVGQAQAVMPGVVEILPVATAVIGGTETAATGGLVATCVATVVCPTAIAAAAIIGVGLYATRDTWVPMLGNIWQPGTTAAPNTSGTLGLPHVALHDLVVGGATMGTATLKMTQEYGVGSTAYHYYDMHHACTAGAATTWGVTRNNLRIGPYSGTVAAPGISCAAGWKLAYFYTTPVDASSPGVQVHYVAADTPAPSTYRATSRCVKADGTKQDVTVDYSVPAGTEPGFMIPSCQSAGVGNHADKVDIGGQLTGRTDFTGIWTVNPPAQPTYPDCDPTMSTGCTLAVFVDGSLCHVGDSRCLDWAEHANERVQCHWGPYTVSRSRCDLLERAYRVGGSTITSPNIDGNPATSTTTTVGDPGPTPYPTPVPFPTDVPVPPTPAPVPLPGVDVDSGCWPSGSAAWNPLEWVLRPVQCALVWAFVPPAGLTPRLSEFSAQWDASAPAVWTTGLVDPLGDVAAAFGSGSAGCGGPEWTISLSMFGGGSYPFRPFDSCREPLASVAPIVKGVATALVLVIGFRAAANPVLGALNLPKIPGRHTLRKDGDT
jgi:hypothetical protein